MRHISPSVAVGLRRRQRLLTLVSCNCVHVAHRRLCLGMPKAILANGHRRADLIEQRSIAVPKSMEAALVGVAKVDRCAASTPGRAFCFLGDAIASSRRRVVGWTQLPLPFCRFF